MKKTIEEQLEWINSELAKERRKMERWCRQRRIAPSAARDHISMLEGVQLTLHTAGQINAILESETGDESEFEQNVRGDRISELLMKMCQLGPERIKR